MKFSIITPCYNSGKKIEEAILSLLHQEFTHWEHIIVDGGSNEETLSILHKYSHLLWISEQDRGIYDAMNKGISMASGQWLLFLGADDLIHDSGVLSKISKAITPDLDAIYGDAISAHFGGRRGGIFNATRIVKENICHQTIFYNRRLFDEFGLYSLKYPLYADWDFNMKILLGGNFKLKYIPEIISKYGAEGLSSHQQDIAFFDDLRRNALCYNYNQLPFDVVWEYMIFLLKVDISKANLRLFIQDLYSIMKTGIRTING